MQRRRPNPRVAKTQLRRLVARDAVFAIHDDNDCGRECKRWELASVRDADKQRRNAAAHHEDVGARCFRVITPFILSNLSRLCCLQAKPNSIATERLTSQPEGTE